MRRTIFEKQFMIQSPLTLWMFTPCRKRSQAAQNGHGNRVTVQPEISPTEAAIHRRLGLDTVVQIEIQDKSQDQDRPESPSDTFPASRTGAKFLRIWAYMWHSPQRLFGEAPAEHRPSRRETTAA